MLLLFTQETQNKQAKIPVYETKDDSIRKMFSTRPIKREESIPKTSDNCMNLDKRIHKILDSIRTKKEISDYSKYDSKD